MKEIKWGCIQPLTGGMYLGARNAIGHPAAWILSYPGLTEVKKDKEGNIVIAGNEYNILEYLRKHNELPPYQVFNKKPFDQTDVHVELINDAEFSTVPVDTSDTDIVVSVPVCSGLSQATIAGDETKDARNCNMVWNAKYALEVVHPKVYIFENAPALYTKSGEHVREALNKLAESYGYSVVYYKTDTRFHDNCQHRPRTFVLFIQHRGDETAAPEMNYEHIMCSIEDYFNRIPDDATQQVTVNMLGYHKYFIDYFRYHFGNDWRAHTKPWLLNTMLEENLFDDFYQWLDTTDCPDKEKEKAHKLFDHIQFKLSQDLNYYAILPALINNNTIPACMFKSIPTTLHYKEDRLFTIREWLHLMGHPFDFELYGDINKNYAKMGQNVPVRTAQWITSEAVRIVENWDTIEREGESVKMFDNTKVA